MNVLTIVSYTMLFIATFNLKRNKLVFYVCTLMGTLGFLTYFVSVKDYGSCGLQLDSISNYWDIV